MPFTASHTAIILPLLRRRIFSASGLLMGSMVPDFEFFIRLQAQVIHGHSFWAMFWLNIPLAILCITLYHIVVRDKMILNLPLYFRKRFEPFLSFDWISYLKSNYVKVIYSIIVGNLSHLLWDSFTHFNGYVVTKIEFLNMEFWQIPLYDILQYGCSVLGAIAILNYIAKMPSLKVEGHFSKKGAISYWFSVVCLTMLTYFLRYDKSVPEDFGAQIVFLCAGFMIGLLVTSAGFSFLQSKNLINLSQEYQTKKL